MEKQLSKVCGADIHKRFLVATILSRDGTKVTDRFGMALDDLLKFKDWVKENQCEQVAKESTGVYWVPLYSVLEDCIPVIVANPYKIKHIPGRKTDLRDAEWIAVRVEDPHAASPPKPSMEPAFSRGYLL